MMTKEERIISSEKAHELLDNVDVNKLAELVYERFNEINWSGGYSIDIDLNLHTAEFEINLGQKSMERIEHYICYARLWPHGYLFDVDDVLGDNQYDLLEVQESMDWDKRQEKAEADENWKDYCIQYLEYWIEYEHARGNMLDYYHEKFDAVYNTSGGISPPRKETK